MIVSVDDFIQKLIQIDKSNVLEFHGCSHDEIRKLMKNQSVEKLPNIYIDFMLKLGKNCPGSVFTGEDLYYDSVLELKDVFADFLEYEKAEWEISDNIFIFWTHHDYKFYFFDVAEGDNPPIYVFIQGAKRPLLTAKSFSVQLTAFYKQHEYIVVNNLR